MVEMAHLRQRRAIPVATESVPYGKLAVCLASCRDVVFEEITGV